MFVSPRAAEGEGRTVFFYILKVKTGIMTAQILNAGAPFLNASEL